MDLLVLVFGSPALLENPGVLRELQEAHPRATVFGRSTAGEIRGTSVSDDTLVATAVHFEHSSVRAAHLEIEQTERSIEVGHRLARSLAHEGLRHAFVLSEGLGVDGTDLVRGSRAGLPESVTRARRQDSRSARVRPAASRRASDFA